MIRFSYLVFVLVLLTGESNAQAPYTNPVIGNPQRVEHEIADPFVLKWDGEYYLYTSGDPITAYQSTDLIHWSSIGPVLRSSDKPEAWNQADVWAPEVVYRNGKFYMYYTASRKSDDWRVGEMARRIGVATSLSPRGPFVDSGEPVTPGWGIDGTVFRDPDGGAEYLFYSYLYEPRLPGAGIVADRLTSWNRAEGKPSNITRGSEAWEDKDGDPNNGSLRYTNEAPTVTKHHGRYYMMYSGGSWDLPTYSLAYATSDVPPEGGLASNGWQKFVPPILRSTALVDAPGHNALVKAPNNVDDICIYHARVVPFLDPWNRLPFVDRIYWNHDRMYMNQPSLGDLSAPDRPIFSSYGKKDERHIPGQADLSQTLPEISSYTNFIYELNLRTFPRDIKPVRSASPENDFAGAGAIVFQKDENWVRVSIETGIVALRAKIAGKFLPPVVHALPGDFLPEALHQLLITRNANRFDVLLDGVHVLNASYKLSGQRGGVGPFSVKMPAEFGYQALTPYYEDFFETPDSAQPWPARSGTWVVEQGALYQVAGGPNRSVAIKGDSIDNYEFTASVLWRDNDSLTSKVGVVAAQNNKELVLAGFDKTIWPFARFWVQHISDDAIGDSFSVGLPRGFQYDVYHTIRIIKQSTAFTFFLDGKEIAAARFPIGASQPGVFTEGARAAFDDLSMKFVAVPQNLVLNPGFETEQWDGTHATNDNPWMLSGSARPNDCCAHSGLRRLIISGAQGAAEQDIVGLTPGRYTLHAWVISTLGSEPQLSVSNSGGPSVRIPAGGEQWHRVSLDFTIPDGRTEATIHFDAGVQSGSSGYAAADDFYLFKQ
jgi:GH43 family beta-xylosidase